MTYGCFMGNQSCCGTSSKTT